MLDSKKKKVVHVVDGNATDQETIVRLRPQIESYVSDKKKFSSTDVKWWMNKDETFGYKITFYE